MSWTVPRISKRRHLLAPVALGVLVLGALACGRGEDDALPRPSQEFCELAFEYDQDVVGIGPDDPAGHLEHLEPMLEVAPDDIRDDLETFTEAMRLVRDGDDSPVGDPDVEMAGQRFYSRAIEGCRLHDQEPPGGF